MKILMLTASMDAGGAETHICALARELTSLGETVTVASAGGRLAKELEENGIEHVYVPTGRSPLSVWRARRRLSELVEKEDFDVIHAHSRISAFVAAPIAEENGVAFVTTVHASFSLSPVKRRLSRWGELTIAVSEDLRHYLCKNYGVSSENTRVIENGIDLSTFSPAREGRVRGRIVFVSRLDKDCSAAALTLCEIAERVAERFPKTEIVVCGGGDMLKEVRTRSERVNERAGRRLTSVLGHVENIAEVLRSADVVVGVSRVALEALACGAIAVLAGNEGFSGLVDGTEALRAAELGNFCCRGEEKLTKEGLYAEVCRALSLSEREREALSKLCRSYVAEKHGVRRMAELTKEAYRSVSAQRQTGRGRVVLGGYYGFGNMGDNALLRASIRRARAEFGDVSISALTKAPRRDGALFGVRCVDRMNPSAVMRELKGARVLVFGGGTLLQDGTSLRSLIYYVALIELAARRGVSVELWGNGLARPRTALAERLVGRALSHARRIGLRDTASVTEALRTVSPEGGERLFLEPDLALGQRPSEPSRVEYLKRSLGLLCDGCASEYAVLAPKGSAARGYLEIFEESLQELSEEGLALVLLPMFPKEDLPLCRRLCERHGARLAEGLSESDAVGLMKDATVVCGMRLHSLVFAASASTPFVGFGGDPKVESFCREHGGVYFTELM